MPTPLKTAFAFLGAPNTPTIVDLAARAEQQGFESLWMAETRIARDGFVPLAAIATATQLARLGTAIVNVYTRGPVVTALSFATLEELAPGRIVIGLGAGSLNILAAQGVTMHKPITRLREYVMAIRALLAGERVSFSGETFKLQDAALEVIPTNPLPVYLGVTGPRALETAGEIADGVILNGFMPVDYVTRALERISNGMARSGNKQPEIAGAIVVSVNADGDTAREAVRPLIATYLTGFPNIARETGVATDVLNAIKTDGASAVPNSVVNHVVIAGTPEECRQRLDTHRQAGVELPILCAIGDPGLVIDTFGLNGGADVATNAGT